MPSTALPLCDAVCPLCQQPNQCAIALGQAAEKCWCMDACIASGLLATLPLSERGQRCICAACAGTGAAAHLALGQGGQNLQGTAK